MINTAVEFKNFTFKYINQKEATLKNINLIIPKGEKVLIAGPSGSGKSTLGNCLNGLIPFAKEGKIEGELLLNGVSPYKESIFEISKYIGTILQDQDGQFIGLSVKEDVAFLDENKEVPKEEMEAHVHEALLSVGMENFLDYSPQDLSGGQKQSVSLAGIMRSTANILLFDEPLANLDPQSGKNAMKLISEIHKKTRKTILVIEHRIEDVLEQDFDRVIIINNGEVVADGTPETLFRSDAFRKYGLREPLYIEALKFAGVDMNSANIYPLSSINSTQNLEKIRNWCEKTNDSSNLFNEEILEVKDLSFGYSEDKKILNNISFSLHKGEILALLGNNGAGKSTLCKVVTGIEKEARGDILLKGNSLKKISVVKRGKEIGYVMQNPNHMITKESLLQEVQFGLEIRKIDNIKKRAEEALKICGLYEFRNWPIASLSYGQKKRLTIATMLALEPNVLILDEPTAGQDYKRYREFMDFIKEIAKKGVGIILITHDMHLALEYADRGIVLCNGDLIADTSIVNILGDKNVMKKAHLKETSLSDMAEIMGIDSKVVMNSFIQDDKKYVDKAGDTNVI